MNKPKLLFYVQHLLGIGHIRRAAVLARAFANGGIEVKFISGGDPVPGLDVAPAEFIQLPPCHTSDIDFKTLLDRKNNPVTPEWEQNRRDQLLSILDQFQPDILMFELFPFGRRQMRFEILPLLEAAKAQKPKPLIVSSVRDILVAQKKPERNDEMVQLANQFFDWVLIHGDPDFIPFDATFPYLHALKADVHYTGYVVDNSIALDSATASGHPEILVSGGGGAVAYELYQTALAAKPLSMGRDHHWRFLLGVNMPRHQVESLNLQAKGQTNLTLEGARQDFPLLLKHAALSISQGGYNTIIESLAVGARSLVVPYAGGMETEQSLRCQLLAARGYLQMVPESELTPASLAGAIDRSLNRVVPKNLPMSVEGAARSLALLNNWLNSR